MKNSIIDVAKLAGVSKSTVSRVLNNGSVSKEAEEKVYKAIEELNYFPNAMARGLRGKSGKIIGVYFPKLQNSPLFDNKAITAQLNGIQMVLNEKDYYLLLVIENLHENEYKDFVPKYMQLLRENKMDGLITIGKFSDEEYLKKAVEKYRSVVYTGERIKDCDGYNIYSNYLKFNKKVYNYFYEHGHRKIAAFTDHITFSEVALRKYDAYREFCEEKDLQYDKSHIIHMREHKNDLQDIVKKMVEDGFTAFYMEDIYVTVKVVGILNDMGIEIPEDIAVISNEYGDNDVINYYPYISVVSIPSYDMGKASATLLLKVIENEEIEQKEILFEPQIIDRGSVKHI